MATSCAPFRQPVPRRTDDVAPRPRRGVEAHLEPGVLIALEDPIQDGLVPRPVLRPWRHRVRLHVDPDELLGQTHPFHRGQVVHGLGVSGVTQPVGLGRRLPRPRSAVPAQLRGFRVGGHRIGADPDTPFLGPLDLGVQARVRVEARAVRETQNHEPGLLLRHRQTLGLARWNPHALRTVGPGGVSTFDGYRFRRGGRRHQHRHRGDSCRQPLHVNSPSVLTMSGLRVTQALRTPRGLQYRDGHVRRHRDRWDEDRLRGRCKWDDRRSGPVPHRRRSRSSGVRNRGILRGTPRRRHWAWHLRALRPESGLPHLWLDSGDSQAWLGQRGSARDAGRQARRSDGIDH